MIKEIRISMADVTEANPKDYSLMKLLYDRGFPCDDTFKFALKPKDGLRYFEYHDNKTGDIVIQWEEENDHHE